nr:YjiH family protein [Tissierella sp.]
MENAMKKNYSIGDYLKFIIPSLIGVLMLMLPFKYEGDTTIMVALLAGKVTSFLGEALPWIIFGLISFTAIVTIIYKLSKPEIIERSEFLKGIFNVSIFWTVARFVGFIIAGLVIFEVGPEWIWSGDTGGLILHDLILGLFSIFLFAGFLLPFLTDFGLLEFVGVLLTPVMRPLFGLPGRASIDCVASWIGDGTIGVSLTNKQYQEGYYTSKEASVIATTFSAVSITFSLVVLKQIGLVNYFGPYYLTILIAGVVAAVIVPKLPPLSNKKDTYFHGIKKDTGEDVPKGYTNVGWGLELAIDKANKSFNAVEFMKSGAKSVLDLWMGVLPVIMAFGTIALIIAEFTPVFSWLGLPFIPLLKLLQVPYAAEASQTIMVGFADMFLPSVIGASIPSELTRFVIAALSVTQLIYLSEAGAVMLGSKIDISLKDLFIIFIERTLITLPIIVLAAHIIF